MMSHLHEVIQVAARSLAASNSVTFFSTDERCSFFIPSQTTPTAVKHFLFIEWWLIMFSLNDLSQITTRSSAVSNWLTKCLPSCQSNPQVLRMNATVLPLPIQVLVHAGCSCQCQGRGLARCRPQSVGRCPEAGGVIKQLLISQRWVQVPIIDIFLSLEWWSMSCWSLKDDSKSQSSTFSWVFSSCQWVANLSKLSSFPSHPRNCESWVVLNELMSSQSWVQLPIMDSWLQASIHWQTSACYAPDRWLVPSVGDSVFWCRWLRPFSSMWNELVLSLCLNWMTHVLGKLLFVFDA